LKQRNIFYGLAIVLAISIAGLAASIHRLSALKAERTQLLSWQARILHQIGSAVNNPAYDGSRPLSAEDASEALADIIGARDDALKLLVMPRPDKLPAPEATGDREISGQAPPPREIAQLLNRQSTGTAGSDIQAIDHDSQSPWKGWE
jgi:hypothetical protein